MCVFGVLSYIGYFVRFVYFLDADVLILGIGGVRIEVGLGFFIWGRVFLYFLGCFILV